MERQDPTLRDALTFLKRGLLTALIVATALAVVTYIISQSSERSYDTATTLLATQPEAKVLGLDASLVTAPRVDSTAYEAAAHSSPVREEAASIVGDPNLFEKIQVDVALEEIKFSSLVTLSVQGPNPSLVSEAANALATSLIAWDERRASRLINRTITQLETQFAELDDQIKVLSTLGTPTSSAQIEGLETIRSQRLTDLSIARSFVASGGASIEVLEPAPVPREPSAPRPLLSAIIAFFLGLLSTYGVMGLRGALDTRIKTSGDLAQLSGFPVMTELPKRAVRTKRVLQEAISYLHTNILFAAPNTTSRVILVTSGRNTGEKSNIALNLARSFVRSKKSVLLVDADLRNPSIASTLKISDMSYPSLQLYLESPDQPLQPVPIYMDESHQLEVVPSFQPAMSPNELLRTGLEDCLKRWKTIYDVIVIDSAPLLAVADSLTVAPLCDTLLFSVNVQDTDRREINAAVELLERSNVPVIGFVATEVEDLSQGEAYGYTPATLSTKETAIVSTSFDRSIVERRTRI